MKVMPLLSGGIDSIALCRHILKSGTMSLNTACFISYGQPAKREEALAAAQWCYLNGASLLSVTCDMDTIALHGMDPKSARVVPLRNLVLISLAAHHASCLELDAVAIGSTLDDDPDYSDCRPSFMAAADEASTLAKGPRIIAPLQYRKKGEIARLLTDEDWKITWSCYDPRRGKQCGRCRSCQEAERVKHAVLRIQDGNETQS